MFSPGGHTITMSLSQSKSKSVYLGFAYIDIITCMIVNGSILNIKKHHIYEIKS